MDGKVKSLSRGMAPLKLRYEWIHSGIKVFKRHQHSSMPSHGPH